jgi:hypothetical protein
MNRDARVVANEQRQSGISVANQIDVDMLSGQSLRVIEHARASPKVSQRDDGDSHISDHVLWHSALAAHLFLK